MKIEKFTRPLCGTVSKRAQDLLAPLAEEFGVTLEPQSGRYTDDSYTFKIVFKATTEGGKPADYERSATLLNLPLDSWGKTFKDMRGSEVTIIGLDLKKRKYPVICKLADGKQIRYMATTVQFALKMADDARAS